MGSSNDTVYVEPQGAANGIGGWELATNSFNSKYNAAMATLSEKHGLTPWGSQEPGSQFMQEYTGTEFPTEPAHTQTVEAIRNVAPNVREAINLNIQADDDQGKRIDQSKGKIDGADPGAAGGGGSAGGGDGSAGGSGSSGSGGSAGSGTSGAGEQGTAVAESGSGSLAASGLTSGVQLTAGTGLFASSIGSMVIADAGRTAEKRADDASSQRPPTVAEIEKMTSQLEHALALVEAQSADVSAQLSALGQGEGTSTAVPAATQGQPSAGGSASEGATQPTPASSGGAAPGGSSEAQSATSEDTASSGGSGGGYAASGSGGSSSAGSGAGAPVAADAGPPGGGGPSENAYSAASTSAEPPGGGGSEAVHLPAATPVATGGDAGSPTGAAPPMAPPPGGGGGAGGPTGRTRLQRRRTRDDQSGPEAEDGTLDERLAEEQRLRDEEQARDDVAQANLGPEAVEAAAVSEPVAPGGSPENERASTADESTGPDETVAPEAVEPARRTHPAL